MIKEIEKPINFLINSIDPKTKGSRAFYSRIFNPVLGWSAPYPETTGYIIKTFDSLIKDFQYDDLKSHSTNMGEWLLSIQNPDGSFQGGLYSPGNSSKSVFNTAQILIGLRSRYESSHDKRFLIAGIKSTEWIANQIDKDGFIFTNSYYKDYMPSYYTRVCWPMLLFSEDCSISPKIKIKKVLDLIKHRQINNTFIEQSGFKPKTPAVLHTIAYTVRGFLESARYFPDDNYFSIAEQISEKLLNIFEITKRLNGEYDRNFKYNRKYRCLTGEAQIVIIWLKIYKKNGDFRFLNAALKMIDSLSKEIPKGSFIFKIGGLSGSKPYYQKYMRFRQPNWATKFFIDAIIEREKTLSLFR
jgi:hypothetical protein